MSGLCQNSETARDLETQPLSTNLQSGALQTRSVGLDVILLVLFWMVFSSGVIIYNKWIFSTGFPYPLTLTCMHMTSCFVVFGTIRKFAPTKIRSSIMPDADVEHSWDMYFKNFLSISVFYATTLGTGQMAYLFSSVAFIQMMKPMNCICASLAAFLIGVEVPTLSHLICVGVIAFGIFFASENAAQFSIAGCALQIVSSITEGFRLSIVQFVTTKGVKLDPVTTVFHFSFASAVLLACASYAHEWPLDFSKLHSKWILVLNCAMAVVLNVLVASVIKKTSAVVFTLCGVAKDMCVIGASSVIFLSPVTRLMVVGYSISLIGLFMYKTYKDNFELFKEQGFLRGAMEVSTTAKKKYLH